MPAQIAVLFSTYSSYQINGIKGKHQENWSSIRIMEFGGWKMQNNNLEKRPVHHGQWHGRKNTREIENGNA